MKRRILVSALALALVLGLSTIAEASLKAQRVKPILTVSGNTATCRQKISSAGAYINLTLGYCQPFCANLILDKTASLPGTGLAVSRQDCAALARVLTADGQPGTIPAAVSP